MPKKYILKSKSFPRDINMVLREEIVLLRVALLIIAVNLFLMSGQG